VQLHRVIDVSIHTMQLCSVENKFQNSGIKIFGQVILKEINSKAIVINGLAAGSYIV
jgi:hypothetical protein